jgi:ATP adenylyltransferase
LQVQSKFNDARFAGAKGLRMDRLWTPWRHDYVSGAAQEGRKGVPAQLEAWPGPDQKCVFCNLILSVDWAIAGGMNADEADAAGLVLARFRTCYICLNRYPYSSGHIMVVPLMHTDSLAKLPADAAEEMIRVAQGMETALREVYKPNGINMGLNLGSAAGAGVTEHIHLHLLPRWVGDTNFMTVVAETRVLPETLEVTWRRLRSVMPQTGMP